jgi:DNA-binding transcriptional MerR regulator
MEPEDYNAAMDTAENILNEEAPLTRKESRAYSKALRSVLARVEKLRSKGFSFVQICAACEKSGILPKNANPYCFRQAFRRERARLLAETELAKLLADGSGTEEKAAVPSPKANTPDSMPAAKTTGAQSNRARAPDKEAAEKEWIRKQTSVTVDTGLGKIIKHSDGSFSFD